MTDLTDRQREVLRFINDHRDKEQCNPTMAEIAKFFGWASPNAAHGHVRLMAVKNVIRIRGNMGSWIRGCVSAFGGCMTLLNVLGLGGLAACAVGVVINLLVGNWSAASWAGACAIWVFAASAEHLFAVNGGES